MIVMDANRKLISGNLGRSQDMKHVIRFNQISEIHAIFEIVSNNNGSGSFHYLGYMGDVDLGCPRNFSNKESFGNPECTGCMTPPPTCRGDHQPSLGSAQCAGWQVLAA